MKKYLILSLCMLITILSSINIVSAATVDNNITVTIDGKNVDFDVPPQLINSRTMVPLRAIFEALNAVVDWNGETKTVTAQKDDTAISLTINNPTMYVNGNAITLDSPACLVSDRTLVPVRAISEAFGTKVDWIENENTVSIITKEIPIEKITFNNSNDTVAVGESKDLSVSIYPQNATNKTLNWTSSNSSIVTVDNGKINGITSGTATIICASNDGVSAECEITVPAVETNDNVKPILYTGNGDKVISNVNIPAGSYYAELTHNGKRNFISKLYYGEKSYDYFSLSNEIGACSLQVALYDNGNAAINNGMLEVKADGEWTIKIKPVTGTTTTNIKGSGRIVTGLFTAKSSRVTVNLSHSGNRNFIAKVIKYNGTKSYDYESLSNEIGNYSGQKVIQLTPGAQYYFYVIADGNWTIDFGEGDGVTSYSVPTVSTSNSNNNSKKDYDDDSNDSGDKKFSYTDAENLNKYAAAATKACNNATSEALTACKKPRMASVYVATALNYASTAKRNMNDVIELLENRVDLTYTDGSTVLENARDALDAINDILDFDAEDDDIIDLSELCLKAASKSVGIEKASVDLIGAFIE